jgi:hypothetical protein
VSSDRLTRVLAALSGDGDERVTSARLCATTRDLVGVSGAGVMLMSGNVPGGSLGTTDEVSRLIEELQYTLGEGPCMDAHRENRVVSEPNLAGTGDARWVAFTPPVIEAGVRAVFAFPLRVGSARLGAIDLYRDGPGPLTDDQHADAMVMADVIANWVLDTQANAPPGVVSEQLEGEGEFHYIVQNAAGAVSVQLGVSITEALIRLRAHAFGNDRLLREVAEDVMARRLRFG